MIACKVIGNVIGSIPGRGWQDRHPVIPGNGPGVRQRESTGRDHLTRPGSRDSRRPGTEYSLRVAAPGGRSPRDMAAHDLCVFRPGETAAIMATLPAARSPAGAAPYRPGTSAPTVK